MKKVIFILMALVIGFTSCKKDEEKLTQEKVLGKWGVESIIFASLVSGVFDTETQPGNPADYLDFRANGKVYAMTDGDKDTLAYTIISENSIKIDDDTFVIKALTDNSFVLYAKVTEGANYFEQTLNLKR